MLSIDVIVPCYGYGHYLRECVESVLAAKTCAVRVLILDDASPDDTPRIAEELRSRDSRVEYIRHAVNRGHIATYNEGLEWARADLVFLLSADDFVTVGALDRAARLFAAHPDLGLVFGPHIEITDDGPPPVTTPVEAAHLAYRIYDTREFALLNRTENPIHTSTAIVRTSLHKQVGGYRPELTHSGDQEMWLRLSLHAPVACIGTAQGVWRNHGRNMSAYYYADMLRDLEQRRLMLDMIFADPASAPIADLRPVLDLGLALSAARSASRPFGHGDRESAQRLMDFARSVSPQVTRTALWRLQTLKLGLGAFLWRRLQHLVTRLLGMSLDRLLRRSQSSEPGWLTLDGPAPRAPAGRAD